MATHRTTAPLTEKSVSAIRAGDEVFISGIIYTARDAAHKRMIDDLSGGRGLPIALTGQIIYYVGPTPPKPGQVIGSAGPTTSGRMDKFTPTMLENGMKACIGKGYRSKEVKEALVKFKGIYLVSTGGAGALLARSIRGSRVVAYEDLGPEAIRELVVEEFPTVCIHDCFGGDYYSEGQSAWRTSNST